MKLEALDALRITRNNRSKRFPREEDQRIDDQLMFPSLQPKYQLSAPSKVFTIGSCFARNIEEALADYSGIELPANKFAAPKSEWPFLRPNGLLNEYNPGTISQRILSALGESHDPEETLIETPEGILDLLLPGGSPVSLERAVARRMEISEIYKDLVSSDFVIVTLGLVEAWFDEECKVFLNRMPPRQNFRRAPDRYSFHQLDVFDSFPLIDRAISKLVEAGVEKILITVSPVPLGTTFTGKDAVVANGFSKAVLRVCAEKLAHEYPEVDYYPSFELVSSGGIGAFDPDHMHVRDEVVRQATGHMLEAYFQDLSPKAENGHLPSQQEIHS